MKWKNQIDIFDELNIELNLEPDSYKKLQKFRPQIRKIYKVVYGNT